MHIHRRQFVIAQMPVNGPRGWLTACIPNLGWISYAPELPLKVIEGREGAQWALIGIAVQTDPSCPDPATALRHCREGDLFQVSRTWAGRWVLAGEHTVQMDATGMLGCFYTIDNEATVRVSSSAALLQDKVDCGSRHNLSHGEGLEWYPPPSSALQGINRLLPSQILRIDSADVVPRPLVVLSDDSNYNENLQRLQTILVKGLKSLAALDADLWLPLTAGYDSRLILAAAIKAGITFRTFTQHYKGMSVADSVIPQELSRVAGVEHRIIESREYSERRANLFDAHTARHSADRDRQFLSHGQWDWAKETDVILRGVGVEAGCPRAARYRFSATQCATDEPDVRGILAAYHERSNEAAKGLEKWHQWCLLTPNAGLDWKDRFYIEQRLAGWGSSIEQGLDLTLAERFPIASCRAFLENVLSVPDHIRATSQHQVDLICTMAPELLQFPFNPKDPLLRRISRRAARHLRFVLPRNIRE